jgi:hypothetical protein
MANSITSAESKDFQGHPQLRVKLQNTSLLKFQDTKTQPNNLNLQVDEDFLATHNFLATQTLLASFAAVDVKVEDDGQEKK